MCPSNYLFFQYGPKNKNSKRVKSRCGVSVAWARSNPGVMVSIHIYENSLHNGLSNSENEPFDLSGSHIGTGIKPLKWKIPHTQTLYQLCVCKYTKSPPYCDGTHTNLPSVVSERVTNCSRSTSHKEDCKLCTGCGWVPDF